MATVTKRKWKTGKGEERKAWVLAFTDADGKRHKEQFGTKALADARRIEVEGQVQKGAYRAAAKETTVAMAVEDYIKYLKGRHNRGEKVTAHYLKIASGQLRNYVAPVAGRAVTFEGGIGHVKLSQLTVRTVSDFRDRLRDAGVSVITTRRILGSLSRTLDYAVANDLVAMNVAKSVKVIGARNEGSEKIVPPSKEALAMMISEADDDLKTKIIFAAATGLRASEMHALRWDRVDLEKPEIVIDQRVDAYKNLDTTKSEAGIRAVPLGKDVVAALKAWRERTKFAGDDDLVFPNRDGGFMDHKNMLRRTYKPLLEKVAKKAKAEGNTFEPVGWHALRHFAISTWIEAGLELKDVQTFAGHSSSAVTMDRYGHMFPKKSHQAAMDKIASENFGLVPVD